MGDLALLAESTLSRKDKSVKVRKLHLGESGMREYVRFASTGVVTVFHILAILVISVGIIKAMLIYFKDALLGQKAREAIEESRMELGHSFSLGLGFLIGASIVNTTVAPTWNDIGQLAAIIAIRTILNYFLLREIATLGLSNQVKKKLFSNDTNHPDRRQKEQDSQAE
jgi:uncharacterized membrane protein